MPPAQGATGRGDHRQGGWRAGQQASAAPQRTDEVVGLCRAAQRPRLPLPFHLHAAAATLLLRRLRLLPRLLALACGRKAVGSGRAAAGGGRAAAAGVGPTRQRPPHCPALLLPLLLPLVGAGGRGKRPRDHAPEPAEEPAAPAHPRTLRLAHGGVQRWGGAAGLQGRRRRDSHQTVSCAVLRPPRPSSPAPPAQPRALPPGPGRPPPPIPACARPGGAARARHFPRTPTTGQTAAPQARPPRPRAIRLPCRPPWAPRRALWVAHPGVWRPQGSYNPLAPPPPAPPGPAPPTQQRFSAPGMEEGPLEEAARLGVLQRLQARPCGIDGLARRAGGPGGRGRGPWA